MLKTIKNISLLGHIAGGVTFPSNIGDAISQAQELREKYLERLGDGVVNDASEPFLDIGLAIVSGTIITTGILLASALFNAVDIRKSLSNKPKAQHNVTLNASKEEI